MGPYVRGGLFSCRARSRPNQANVSTAGAVCTRIAHIPTAVGGPELKKKLSGGVHIGPGTAVQVSSRRVARNLPDFDENAQEWV